MGVSKGVVKQVGRKSQRRHHGSGAQDVEALYVLQAQIGRAVSHPLRIHILDLLSTGEKTGTELRAFLDVGKVNLSQHLLLLKQAGLVRSRQRGRESLYSIAIPEITHACQLMRNVLAARLQHESELMKALQTPKQRPLGKKFPQR